MKKLLEGIYAIETPTPNGQHICYALQDGAFYTLVDIGPVTDAARGIWQQYVKQGLKVNRLIATNPLTLSTTMMLQKLFEAPILAVSTSKPNMAYLNSYGIEQQHIQLLTLIDEELVHGDVLKIGSYQWQVVQTAGISQSDFVLYEPKQHICLLGRIVTNDPAIVQCSSQQDEALMSQLFQSLQLLLTYDMAYSFSSEQAPIYDVKQAIYTVQNNYLQLLRKVYDSLYKETTVETLAEKLAYDDATAVLSLLHYLVEIEKVEINRHNIPHTFQARRRGLDGMSYLMHQL